MSYIKAYLLGVIVILFFINFNCALDLPKIKRLVKLRSGRHGLTRILIQCTATGNPRPVLHWTFKGKKVIANSHYKLESDNRVLTVVDVTKNDTGKYRCYAQNKYGMNFGEIDIKILGVGQFHAPYTTDDLPLVRNVTIGQPLELTCPPHTDKYGQNYRWAIPPLDFLNPGSPNERAFLSNSHGALYFSYITAADVKEINSRGGVSCILYVDFSNLEPSVKITLRGDGKASDANQKPKMTVFMKNNTVAIEGDTTQILCGATGRPHPLLKWYKDGKLISKADGKFSTISNIMFDGKGLVLNMYGVKKENAGLYKCVANNTEGSVSREATFIVNSKVKFTKELQEQNNIPVKQPVTLECAVTANPKAKFVWYHNNTIISTNARRTVKEGKMHIPETDFKDCGMYLCSAENKINTVVSPAYVKILDVAPTFLKELKKVYYYLEREHYKIFCNVTGGPEPTVKWYRNDKLIQNSEHLIVQPDGTLQFKDVLKDQNGVYKCVAENRKAKVESSGTVKVFRKTIIHKRPIAVKYRAGATAHLFCDAVYDKTLKVTWQWLRDGKVLDVNGDRVYLKDKERTDKKIKTHTLKIKNLKVEDAGKYTCNVFTVDDATFRSQDNATGSITVIAAPLPVGDLKLTGKFDDKKDKAGKDAAGKGETSDPTKKPSTDGEPTLTWKAPSKYVGPPQKYLIQYAKADKANSKNPDDWTDYNPPKKYTDPSVKLEKDKLPASQDLVFRIKAIATDKNGKEMVGEPSKPTKPGSLVTPARAPRGKPSNVRLLPPADGKKDGNLSVAWDKLDEVNKPGPGFKIVGSIREIKPKKGPFTNFTKDDGNSVQGPAASDDGVDKEYEVRVRNKNDAGLGPEEVIILKVPGKKVNVKVVNVTLVSVTKTSVSIKWSPVKGATGYRVYYTKSDTRRRRASTKPAYKDSKTNSIIIKIGDEKGALKPGAKYTFTVAATNFKGEGPASDDLPVETQKDAPGTPDGVDLKTYADTIALGWKPANDPDIKNYTVSWYPEDDPKEKKEKNVDGKEQQAFITDKDDTLDPQKYYTVKLAANSDAGKGKPWVMEGVVVGSPDEPSKPGRPIATPLNYTKVNATFTIPDKDYTGALPKKFKVYYQKGSDPPKSVEGEYPKKPFVVIDNLKPGETYKIWAVPIKKDGVTEGERSDTTTVTTPEIPTTTPATTTTTTEKISTTEVVNDTAIVVVGKSTEDNDKAFYEELWFIILLIILLILLIILIILCCICNRRGGRYPVGDKEKNYGAWDKEPLKDYDDMENGSVPLVGPAKSPSEDSLKKPLEEDEDIDSLEDYGEGYGDIGQYGANNKKGPQGQPVV